MTPEQLSDLALEHNVDLAMGDPIEAMQEVQDRAVRACVDMAERYDADIEGCDGDELLRYGEGIECSFRLAYIIKYGTFPPKGDAWSVEFVKILEQIRKEVHTKSV
jgi:hypothetical protein